MIIVISTFDKWYKAMAYVDDIITAMREHRALAPRYRIYRSKSYPYRWCVAREAFDTGNTVSTKLPLASSRDL